MLLFGFFVLITFCVWVRGRFSIREKEMSIFNLPTVSPCGNESSWLMPTQTLWLCFYSNTNIYDGYYCGFWLVISLYSLGRETQFQNIYRNCCYLRLNRLTAAAFLLMIPQFNAEMPHERSNRSYGWLNSYSLTKKHIIFQIKRQTSQLHSQLVTFHNHVVTQIQKNDQIRVII